MKEGLTKILLADKVSGKLAISQKEALGYVELLLETMKKTLEAGETIKVSGFGNFVVKTKADRKGRNPQTGETITITSRKILSFKPSTIMKARLNNG